MNASTQDGDGNVEVIESDATAAIATTARTGWFLTQDSILFDTTRRLLVVYAIQCQLVW